MGVNGTPKLEAAVEIIFATSGYEKLHSISSPRPLSRSTRKQSSIQSRSRQSHTTLSPLVPVLLRSPNSELDRRMHQNWLAPGTGGIIHRLRKVMHVIGLR